MMGFECRFLIEDGQIDGEYFILKDFKLHDLP